MTHHQIMILLYSFKIVGRTTFPQFLIIQNPTTPCYFRLPFYQGQWLSLIHIFLKQYAQEIISLTQKAERELSRNQEELSGDIYIGGGESASMRLIMRVIASMQKMHPKIQFHLFSGNAQDVADKLESGLLDFGIFFGPVNLSQYDYFTLPGKEVMGVLMRKDDPLAQHDAITPDMLRNQPIKMCIRDRFVSFVTC